MRAGEVWDRMPDSFQKDPDSISASCFCFLRAVILHLVLACGAASLQRCAAKIVLLGCRGVTWLHRHCMFLTRKKPNGFPKIILLCR